MNGSTGIAPGFGGFAVTPDGQAQYMARHYNPYAFLQQPIGQQNLMPQDQGTAPAAEQSFATGGLVPLQSPAGLTAATRFMRLRSKPYAWGGYVRFDEGGSTGEGSDSTGNDGNAGADGGQNGGMGGAAASAADAASGGPSGSPGADGGGFASAGFSDPAMGFDAGFGNPGPAGYASSAPAAPSAFDAPGLEPGAMLGFNNEEVGLSQMGYAAAMGGLKGALGPAGSLAGFAADKVGLGPSAVGMGPGASKGAGIGAAVGGMMGGPAGAMAGAAMGAMAGGHGQMGGGALGGLGSTAGTAGTAQSTAGAPSTNAPDGFGMNLGMDAAPDGSTVGIGGPTGNADATNIPGASSNATDLSALIRNIESALKKNGVQGLAAGGQVRGRALPNHAFHQGSGLVHGTSDGRADALYTHVPPGGYVVPADVVSGLGQGNTMAGAKKLTQAMPPVSPPDGSPPGGSPTGFASGGAVPVRLSAGEFYVHPHHVRALGGSDKLDAMVQGVRQQNQRQVAAMPPPR